MLSALISSGHSYSALLLTKQQKHQRSVIPGPLVLRNEPLKSPAPMTDKDRQFVTFVTCVCRHVTTNRDSVLNRGGQ